MVAKFLKMHFDVKDIYIFKKYLKTFTVALIFIFMIILWMKTEILTSFWLSENFREDFAREKFSLEILHEDATDCLLHLKGRHDEEERTILSVITSFSDILSLLKVKAVIIEPSILYCMLSPKYQELLSKRHFNISNFLESRHVITYGIMEEDVTILQQERNIYKFAIMGFRVHFNQAPVKELMLKETFVSKLNSFSSHIFFTHKLYIFHIVVLYKRNNYFWHAALDISYPEEILPKEKLLFTNHEGAYEKFSFVSLENKMLPVADFYVPSNAHYFLLEMMSSRFIECNISQATAVLSKKHSGSHRLMSVKHFNIKTVTALQDLKKIFHPLLMHLWIWSGTLLGWYRECHIIPNTTDIDFGSWASDLEDLDLITNMLQNNEHLKLKRGMDLSEEALEFRIYCHGLRMNVYFLRRIQRDSWNSTHEPDLEYYFRYFYPPFTLCSADLLGEKVQVPCETEDVIAAEYGPDWSKLTSSWNYESSPKNRGPNIYWKKQKLKDAY